MGRKNRRKPNKSHSNPGLTNNVPAFPPEVHAEISTLFNKKFMYTRDNHSTWTLPSVDRIFQGKQWTDTALQATKDSLNEVKCKLSDLDITLWHAHTQTMNRAGDEMNSIRRNIRVELCTQAWCKFFEILNSYSIVPLDAPSLSSLHICEAPGAFITSLNHYLQMAGLSHLLNDCKEVLWVGMKTIQKI
jgi:cap2 methyltransferase